MKPALRMLLLVCAFVFPTLAGDEAKLAISRLTQIDLELTLEQYKQTQMEQFRNDMQLNLLPTSEDTDDERRKQNRDRLQTRRRILQGMADELRAKVAHLEHELAGPARPESKAESASRKEAAAVEGELHKRMQGTWQLVSFADGCVSEGNVGELKFIGDRHWSVSRLNPQTGRLDYHIGGTYRLEGNEYVETVEYGTGGPIGQTFTYNLTVEGEKFVQVGVGNPWSLVFKRAK